MGRNERWTLVVIGLLLFGGSLFWISRRGPSRSSETPASTPSTTTTTLMEAPMPAPSPAPVKPTSSTRNPTKVPTSNSDKPKAPEIKLHKELIPKNIEIVRCYYSREIAPPGTSFEFDVNGSGFTEEFGKMIRVESGVDGVEVRNLKLVTANQIHGEMVIGASAKTGFIYPRVLIKNLPVFQAPDPFAVIRKGEVLNVVFISMEESGRAGRFRVFTHLDEALYKRFQVVPSTPNLSITDVAPQLPYIVDGTLRIGPGLPPGEYGLTIKVGEKNVFERLGMIRIVRPNVGANGFVQGITTQERFRRPGDVIDFYVLGSGFQAPDLGDLVGQIKEFDVGRASFSFINGTQLRMSFSNTAAIPPGSYGVLIKSASGNPLYEKADVFRVVGPDWVAGVQVAPPARPGQKSTLRLIGRDFSATFIQLLTVEIDEPGLKLSPFTRSDANTLSAEISVGAEVRPGDYWLQLKAAGKKISPPYGSIIKVESNPQ